jgi:hypothetical protein
MAPRLVLFPFRFRDPVTGKWVRARYVAELHQIKARHTEFEIIGPPEVRDIDPTARYFVPHQRDVPFAVANLGPLIEIAGWKPTRRVTVAGVAS